MMSLLKKSRFIFFALVLSFLFVLFFAQSVFAQNIALSASQETGLVGETVTVEIRITDALGTEGGQFDLSFGPLLEAVAIRNGDFLPQLTEGQNYNLKAGDNKLRVLWVTAAGSSKESGVLCYIDFKIIEEGATELKFSDFLVLDEDTNAATVNTTSGKVTGTVKDDKDIHIQKAIDAISVIAEVVDCNNSAHRTQITMARAIVDTAINNHGVKTNEISNYSKLLEAEKKIAICDAITAANVAIAAIPDKVTLDDEVKVVNARQKVNAAIALGAQDKDFQNLDRLTEAEARIKELKGQGKKPEVPKTGGVSFFVMGGVLFLIIGAVILRRRQLLSGR